jgi:hypothetical protein
MTIFLNKTRQRRQSRMRGLSISIGCEEPLASLKLSKNLKTKGKERQLS